MSDLLSTLKGHDAIVESFLRGLERDQLASSYLFVGPKGVGKSLAAKALSQALLCERPGPRPCGACPSCIRLAGGTSEAYIEVHPEGGTIKVDQSRQIIRRLSLQTAGRAQVVVIHEAENLNPQAGNALLKMIEEPPAGCFFFLLAPSPSSVLPTIRSRCQIFRFAPLPMAALRDLTGEEEWLLRASRGSLARLRELEDDALQEVRQLAAHIIWWALYDPNEFMSGDWRKGLKDKERVSSLIHFITLFLRDALLLRMGGREILAADFEELLQGIAKDPRIEQLAEKIVSLERAIKGNAEPQLALDHFFISSELGATV